MATYNIVKQSSGDVNLIEITSGYTRVLKPTFLPYHALGRVYFGNGDNVAFSEITQLNGSSVGLPTDIDAMIVKLNNDFFTSYGSGSGGTTNATSEQFEIVNGVFQIKQSWLTSFIQSVAGGGGAITPAAPTNGVVDNTARTFAFTLTPGYALSEHEYQIGAGSITSATNPINVGNGALAIGDVKVRVKAATGRNASSWLTNATAFTAVSGGGQDVAVTNWQSIVGSPVIEENNINSTTNSDRATSSVSLSSGESATLTAVPSGAWIGLGLDLNYSGVANDLKHGMTRDISNGKILCITSGSYFSDNVSTPVGTLVRLVADGELVSYEYSVDNSVNWLIAQTKPQESETMYIKYASSDLNEFVNDITYKSL